MRHAARMIEATQAIAIREPGLTARQEAAAHEDRFAALVERHSRFVFRVAYALLRNSHDAEDAAQETFLKVYRAGAWEAIENERAFLSRAAWRIAVDKLRKVRHEPLDPEMEIRGDISPEEAAVAADWNSTVHRLVDALPPELRQPLALSTVQEMNSREIALAMGIAEGTVRTRIMRARQILRQKLAGLMEGRYGKQ
ncbi:MAG TPA: sigma-70 family RNA polymerase sigma factor [Bryobacteraceae bacterium]|nr:sigma-70 family RNA polymerase sigma factor [Bryobacteraceae bacterium]